MNLSPRRAEYLHGRLNSFRGLKARFRPLIGGQDGRNRLVTFRRFGPVPSSMTSERVQEFDIQLGSDREWHSKPMRLRSGTRATLTATGEANFYAGLFAREAYIRKTAVRGPFGFEFGTDRASFTSEYTLDKTDDYYLVFRVGVFSNPQTSHVRWIVQEPGV